MDEQIKKIITTYTGIAADEISGTVKIDKSAFVSSIHVHRFYAALAQAGYSIENYQTVKTVDDLIQRMNGNTSLEQLSNSGVNSFAAGDDSSTSQAVGIDMEAVAEMPLTGDFREHAFYTSNFSSSEIAYCILQPSPYESFAGLFAVKEALVKADGSFKSKPFHQIIVQHSQEGKPEFPGYNVSISHTNALAVAVVVKQITQTNNIAQEFSGSPGKGNAQTNWSLIIAVLALLTGITALLLYLRS